MNIYSLLSFFAFIVYLYLGIYALRLDKRGRLNRIFFLLALSFAIWAFSYTFLYPAKDKESCWFWFKIGSIGWCNFACFSLHFHLILAKKKLRWWIYPLIYTPGAVFTIKSLFFGLLASDFILKPFGWAFVIPLSSYWAFTFYFYYSIYIITCILLCKFLREKTPSQREKKQAGIIIITTIISLVLGSLIDVILPALRVYILPPIASSTTLIWGCGIWLAIVKYRLMILSPKISVNEIVTIMREILILISPSGHIIKTNPRTEELLGYSENELRGKGIDGIIAEKEDIKNYIAKIKEGLSSDLDSKFHLLSSSGEAIPIGMKGISVSDEEENMVGIILLAEDLRKAKELEAIYEKIRTFNTFLSEKLILSIVHIEGFCRAILKHNIESLDSPTRYNIEGILERCKEINKLIEDFLK